MDTRKLMSIKKASSMENKFFSALPSPDKASKKYTQAVIVCHIFRVASILLTGERDFGMTIMEK